MQLIKFSIAISPYWLRQWLGIKLNWWVFGHFNAASDTSLDILIKVMSFRNHGMFFECLEFLNRIISGCPYTAIWQIKAEECRRILDKHLMIFRLQLSVPTWSISCILMLWLLASRGQQQPLYWLCNIATPIFHNMSVELYYHRDCSGVGSSNERRRCIATSSLVGWTHTHDPCHYSFEKCKKMQIQFEFPKKSLMVA